MGGSALPDGVGPARPRVRLFYRRREPTGRHAEGGSSRHRPFSAFVLVSVHDKKLWTLMVSGLVVSQTERGYCIGYLDEIGSQRDGRPPV